VGALYGRTSVIPDTVVREGAEAWNPAEFIYPPGMANFFIVVVGIWRQFDGVITPMKDTSFEVFWKLGLAAFILLSAGVIFSISIRMTGGSSNWALLLAVLLALNPAIIFDGPIWGQSNALLSFVLLLALLALIVNMPRLMWASLIIAILLKQTALLVVPVIAIFALGGFGLRRTLVDAAFGSVAGFAFMAPVILAGYHPATTYLTTAGKIIDFGSSLTSYDTQVSADTFPIWVLFTGFNGLHGHDRMWTSDHTAVGPASLSYATAGLVLFAIVGVIAAAIAWRAARQEVPSFRRLCIAIGLVVVAYVTLNTRTSGHYLTLAIPFLLLGLPYASRPIAFWKLAGITLSALLSAYGLFMFIAVRGEWPNFIGLGSPSTSVVSAAVYRVYTSDLGITMFALLMLLITVSLLIDLISDAWPITAGLRLTAPKGQHRPAGAQ
jgi:Glycosyltransferase family 87